MFLTTEQLQALTGFKRPSAQMRWLRENGYRFTVNGLARPVVAVAEMEQQLTGRKPTAQPNFEALHGT